MKPCPIETEIKLHTIPKEHDCPKIRNAIQRCHYRKTKAGSEGNKTLEALTERAQIAEDALLDAQAQIAILKTKAKNKKKKKSSDTVK